MARHSAGGDGTTGSKSCSSEQASMGFRSSRERRTFETNRISASWFTTNLKIDGREVITDVTIKEDGCMILSGTVVESNVDGPSRTIYFLAYTTIQVKEALVTLLDLCIECLGCQHLAFAVKRSEAVAVLENLRWVGFSLINPDVIVKNRSVLEDYVFMGIDL